MSDDMVPCDICKGEKIIISRWAWETGGKTIRCPGCMGRGEVPLSVIRAKQKRKLEESRAAQNLPPEPSEPQNPSENPQSMPITDRDYYHGKHPAACTCVECVRQRLGSTYGTTGSCTCASCESRRGRQPGRPPIHHGGAPRKSKESPVHYIAKKRRGFWGWTKWLVARLLILAVLSTAAATAYHWYNGAPLASAFTMTTDDYRLIAACPTEVEAFWEFFRRPSQEDYVPMSDRYGDDWTEQICNAGAARQQSMPTPDTQAMVQAAIAATVQSITAADTTLLPTATPSSTPLLIAAPTSTPLLPTATPSPTPDTQAMVQAAIEATVQSITAADTTATPSPTPEPVSAVLPTATPASTPTPTNTPLPMATPTSTPLPTATPTNTPTPIPTAVVRPSERHIELKRYMLELINEERARAGVDPVVLGDNIAAQLHAESSLANCFSGHWGVKPYMRYSLAGGYQSNGENALGFDYCVPASGRFATLGSMEQEIRDGMDLWMGSSGHRRSILDPWYKKVNIGLAWDRYNFSAIQHFEGDYVEYDQFPTIENGILTISGTVKNGASFADAFSPQIYYDAPPHTLTRGQLSYTYCYDTGLQVAALRRPLSSNWYYPVHEFTDTYRKCLDPYEVPADAPAPRPPSSPFPPVAPPQPPPSLSVITVPYITASAWRVDSKGFSFRADLSDLLSKHGAGVYSIMIWGEVSGRSLVISQYSIFYGVTPPDTYDPSRYD